MSFGQLIFPCRNVSVATIVAGGIIFLCLGTGTARAQPSGGDNLDDVLGDRDDDISDLLGGTDGDNNETQDSGTGSGGTGSDGAPGDGTPPPTDDLDLNNLLESQFGADIDQVDPELQQTFQSANRFLQQRNLQAAFEEFGKALVRIQLLESQPAIPAYLSQAKSAALEQRGRILAAGGQNAAAITQFSAILADDPRNATAYYLRGQSLAALGDYDLAVKSYSRAVVYGQNKPEQFLYYAARGEAYSELGRYREALDDFDQAIELQPTQPEYLFGRGSALMNLGLQERSQQIPTAVERLQLALASFDRAIEMNPKYAEAYFERGILKGELGESEEAVQDLIKAAEIDPNDVRFQERVAYIYLQRAAELANKKTAGNAEILSLYEKSVEAFDKTIAAVKEAKEKKEAAAIPAAATPAGGSAPGTGDAEGSSGLEKNAPADGGILPGANGTDLAAGGADGDNGGGAPPTKSPEALASVPDTSGETPSEKAAADLEERVKLDELYVARAIARIRMAEYVEPSQRERVFLAAVEDCTLAIEEEDQQPQAYFQRGLAYRLIGDYLKAVDSLTRALEISPDFAEAHFRRGIVWFHLGEYQLAKSDFSDANLAGTTDARSLFWTGLCQAQEGEFSEAVQSYSRAIQENPDFALAYSNRGLAYMYLERYERAVSDFSEVIRRDRKNPEPYLRRGYALEKMGSKVAAVVSYEQAVQIDPEYAPAHRRLGFLYEELGRGEEAREHQSRAQQLNPVEL